MRTHDEPHVKTVKYRGFTCYSAKDRIVAHEGCVSRRSQNLAMLHRGSHSQRSPTLAGWHRCLFIPHRLRVPLPQSLLHLLQFIVQLLGFFSAPAI
ncbi:hypothetical protein VNO78_06006 [Psophocarpus tetragonolobus]|uniref:Uncharacterized protein n=1 Tax=Psophocarpus tetragonolobus TaxID=3891 RepID=A0AAN9SSL1_PSOTE